MKQTLTEPAPAASVDEQRVSILIAEDEKKLVQSISKQLERNGFSVEAAYTGVRAQEILESKKISLLLLDINLPEKNGLQVLTWMQSASIAVPVIVISAADRVDDRVTALQLGADDYLVKPFDSTELLARIGAVLRRMGNSQVSVLKAADLVLNLVSRTAIRAGKQIPLSQKEFSLLEFFLRNKNRIITRDRLIEQVWGYTFDTETNIVDVYISYLRKAIDKGFSKKLIHTIHGEGFILSE
jgi:two-component system copper resistance phosphate regulon response regulator CusR